MLPFKKTTFLLCAFLYCTLANSQILSIDTLSYQYSAIKKYSILDGLASNETYHSHIDKRGYIWISSDKGISRFDGYSFTNFTTKDGLIDNTIFNIFEDEKGRIWFIGFNKKLCYYDWGKKEFHEYKYNKIIEQLKQKYEILKQFNINGFSFDAENNLYLNIRNKIITIYNDGTHSLKDNKEASIINFQELNTLNIDFEKNDLNNITKTKTHDLINTRSNGFYLVSNQAFSAVKNIEINHFNTIGIYRNGEILHFDSENKHQHVSMHEDSNFVLINRVKQTNSQYYPTFSNLNNQKFYSTIQFIYPLDSSLFVTANSLLINKDKIYFTFDNFLNIIDKGKISSILYTKRIFSSCVYKNQLILGTENGFAILLNDSTIKNYNIPKVNLNNIRIQCLLNYKEYTHYSKQELDGIFLNK
jgi:hypothetical protein